MTALGYGWAQPIVCALCESEHRNISFCLGADSPTRFYVLLAIRGWERQPRQLSFERFSSDLATVSRRALLKRLWGLDLGSLSLLKRCAGGSLWSRKSIDGLARCLGDPRAREILTRQAKVTHKLVRVVSAWPAEAPVDQVELAVRIGANEAAYLLKGLAAYAGLDRSEAIATLARLKDRYGIEKAFYEAASDVTLPKPPWPGTDAVRPLRTMRAIREAGVAFSNCLTDPAYGFHALSGGSVIYVGDIDGERFCARLRRDRVLQSWRLTEVNGIRNLRLNPRRHAAVVDIFRAAGFAYLTRAPVELWFEGL